MDMKLTNTSFGARVAAIPYTKGIASQKVALNDVKLNGLTALIGGDLFENSGKIKKHNLLFLDKELIAIDDYNPDIIPSNSQVNYVDISDKTVSEPVVDPHTHRILAYNTKNKIHSYLRNLKAGGTGAIMATLIPDTIPNLKSQIRLINSVMSSQKPDEAKILGIYLEGPFFSPQKTGIHKPENVLKPTVDNFLALEPENVKLVTVAPELDNKFKFIKYLNKHDIIPACGHCMPEPNIMEQAIKAGMKYVTHFLNGMPAPAPRIPTMANKLLDASDEITFEVMSEKHHWLPPFFNMALDEIPLKNILLVSDELPHGKKNSFFMGGKKIYIKNEIAQDAQGCLAGGIRPLHELAGDVVGRTKMTFEMFLQCACRNAAEHFGYDNAIKIGNNSNILIWDNKTLKPEKTL